MASSRVVSTIDFRARAPGGQGRFTEVFATFLESRYNSEPSRQIKVSNFEEH